MGERRHAATSASPIARTAVVAPSLPGTGYGFDRWSSDTDDTQRKGCGIRVLVVDDEPDLRRLVRAVFVRQHIEVTEAADGAEAIERLTAGTFEVVLLDFNLPDMPSAEVLRVAREVDPSTKVIVLTGDAPDVDRARTLIAGADRYFVKPFSVRDLVASVRELGGAG